MSKTTSSARQLAICVKNDGYPAALEKRKIYIVVPDPVAAKHRLIRVIDESGDDYLYPKSFFVAVTLPTAVRKAVLVAA